MDVFLSDTVVVTIGIRTQEQVPVSRSVAIVRSGTTSLDILVLEQIEKPEFDPEVHKMLQMTPLGGGHTRTDNRIASSRNMVELHETYSAAKSPEERVRILIAWFGVLLDDEEGVHAGKRWRIGRFAISQHSVRLFRREYESNSDLVLKALQRHVRDHPGTREMRDVLVKTLQEAKANTPLEPTR